MSNPIDLSATSTESGDISVTTVATKLSALLSTGSVTSPTASPLAFIHIYVPAGSTIYYGGSTVTATAGAHHGIPIPAPLTGPFLWEVPRELRDPTRLYLIAAGATTVTVARGLVS